MFSTGAKRRVTTPSALVETFFVYPAVCSSVCDCLLSVVLSLPLCVMQDFLMTRSAELVNLQLRIIFMF